MSDRISKRPKPEAQAVRAQYDQARRAMIPDLNEVRQYREMLLDFVVEHALELMEADRNKETVRVKVSIIRDVVSTDSPSLSTPRGFCSPVKTEDIKQFEKLVRKVFGDVEFCETAWRGGYWREIDA
jgi:hypothetical protein